MPRESRTGRLRIGDEWNAISLLARTQSNPLKAVAELVENALDAKARTVEIVRSRRGGRVTLTVIDDGEGVRLDPEGRPDFRYVATHVCDSMKRHLQERQGVHGEFGIGLLGFWSVGEELRLASRGSDGAAWEMVMKRGDPRYRVHPLRGKLTFAGAEVGIGPLIESTRMILTGEKLDRYLASELRDRIRQRGATVRIHDRVARKAFTVRPREFEGEPVDVVRHLPVPAHGEAAAELYYRVPPDGASIGIYLCRDGTRVLPDVRLLGGLDREPWTLNRLEGVIDCPALSVAPATREGIVPDTASAALIEALGRVEPVLVGFIRKREEATAEKASEQIQKEVHRALVAALRQIPEGDYHLFDVGEDRAASAGGDGRASAVAAELPDLHAGPLASARLSPARIRLGPNEQRGVTTRALDAEGRGILGGLDFAWEFVGSCALIEPEEHRAVLTGLREGEGTVRVIVRQGDVEARAEGPVIVTVAEPATGTGTGDGRGIPSYRLVSAPGEPWRSRYASTGAIEINSAHHDYLAARTKMRALRRYIGKLYAKEVILLNFPTHTAPPALDRMVELLTRMEERL